MPITGKHKLKGFGYTMAKLKRLASAVVSIAMAAVMLTSCNSGRYCMSYDNKDINSGVYIYNIMSELLNQQYMMYYTGEDSSKLMDKEIEGKKMSEFLEDTAMKNTKEYCALSEQFKKLGLSFSEEDKKSISSSATSAYNAQKSMFEEMGISKESIKMVIEQGKMRDSIFEYYYGKEGKNAVSDEELEKYVNESYLRYKVISISKSTKSDKAEKEKENKENEELIEKYFKQAEGKSFEDFDAVIEQYNKDVEEKNKAASDSTSSDTDSSSASTDSSSASTDSSSSDSDLSTVSLDSSKVGEPDSSSQADSSSQTDSSAASDDTSSVADTNSSAADEHDHEHDDDSSAADAENSKYKNESMVNYANLNESTLKEDYGKLLTKIKDMSQGKAEKFDNDSTYYIIIKGDVTQKSKEYVSENRDTVLKEMKDKDFDKMIEDWEKELNIKVDDNAIKRYSATSLFDRYTNYLSKNQKS